MVKAASALIPSAIPRPHTSSLYTSTMCDFESDLIKSTSADIRYSSDGVNLNRPSSGMASAVAVEDGDTTTKSLSEIYPSMLWAALLVVGPTKCNSLSVS